VYSITPPGQQSFSNWLRGPFPVQESKSGPLVQVFFLAQLSDEDVLAKFETAAEIFRVLLARYERVPQESEEYFRKVPSPREHYFWMLTLDLGLRTMRTQLEWAESVIAAIKNHRIPPV
jgi:hypothetical protein